MVIIMTYINPYDTSGQSVFYTFQSNGTMYENESSLTIDWKTLFYSDGPFKIYLPLLIRNYVAPFISMVRRKSFTWYKFKLGRSKK